jgi:hypothetical protein
MMVIDTPQHCRNHTIFWGYSWWFQSW